jgi:hypothetical protein
MSGLYRRILSVLRLGAVLFIFFTAVYPDFALSKDLDCRLFYRARGQATAKASPPSFSDFQKLLHRHFGNGQPIGMLVSELFEDPQTLIQFYKTATHETRQELLRSIQKGYLEAVTLKNSDRYDITFLKRIMDVFLNVEADKTIGEVKTIEDLEKEFRKTNEFLGSKNTISFNSMITMTVYLQKKLQDTGSLLNFLKSRQKTLLGRYQNDSRFKKEIEAIKVHVSRLEQKGQNNEIEVWAYGSAIVGRGIKNISDYDIHLPTELMPSLEPYLTDTRNDGILKLTQLSEISALGVDPSVPSEHGRMIRSEWAIKITASEIKFYVYDPASNKMRPL